jgi:hypothetical protein
MSDHPKSCLCCKHFWFYLGARHWSDDTPGEAGFIRCFKERFGEGKEIPFPAAVAKDIDLDMAKDCEDFEHR